MKKQPQSIITATLNVLIMPNGEIICLGKSLGWFKNFKEQLNPVADVTGKPITEKDL